VKFLVTKKTLWISLLLILGLGLFAQEVESLETAEKTETTEATEATETELTEESENLKPKKSFWDIFGVSAGFGPALYLNTQSTLNSAPSPIFYPVSIGLSIPRDAWISLQPAIKFWTGYYLITDEIVAPAEIENRTAKVYSFLLDFPVMFRIDFFDKLDFRASAGIAVFARYGTLAGGVKESDYGFYGTAGKDLEYINKWFFDNLRFVYLSGGASFIFNYGRLMYGPEASLYVPISILTDFSFDAVILSVGLKIIF